MENLAERKESTSEQSPKLETNALQKPANGKKNTPVMTAPKVMTEEEVLSLLARLQDILSLWAGSSNTIINGYVMTALPIPPVMTIGKVEKRGSHDKVFTVNNKPVVSLEKS